MLLYFIIPFFKRKLLAEILYRKIGGFFSAMSLIFIIYPLLVLFLINIFEFVGLDFANSNSNIFLFLRGAYLLDAIYSFIIFVNYEWTYDRVELKDQALQAIQMENRRVQFIEKTKLTNPGIIERIQNINGEVDYNELRSELQKEKDKKERDERNEYIDNYVARMLSEVKSNKSPNISKMKVRYFYGTACYKTWPKLFVLTEDGKFYSEYLDYMRLVTMEQNYDFNSFKSETYKWSGYQTIIEISEETAKSKILTKQSNWIEKYLQRINR